MCAAVGFIWMVILILIVKGGGTEEENFKIMAFFFLAFHFFLVRLASRGVNKEI